MPTMVPPTLQQTESLPPYVHTGPVFLNFLSECALPRQRLYLADFLPCWLFCQPRYCTVGGRHQVDWVRALKSHHPVHVHGLITFPRDNAEGRDSVWMTTPFSFLVNTKFLRLMSMSFSQHPTSLEGLPDRSVIGHISSWRANIELSSVSIFARKTTRSPPPGRELRRPEST
jgi:hypothetical protein